MQMLQANSAVVGGIQCEWVPGTMDRVRIRMPENELLLSLDQLKQAAGLDAVHEMYLKGLISLPYSSRLQEAFAAFKR